LPVGRFCNLVWFWMTDGAERTDVEKLEIQLWTPPVGEEGQGVWSAEAEMEAFNALRTALGQ
jgi:hypothetical protein